MYQKQLHLLGLLLETTQGGQTVWRREDVNTHRSQISGFPCRVRFRRLGLAAEAATPPDEVEVSVGEETLAFCRGSEGYDLVEQILEAAYPEVFQQAHQTAIRLDAMMNRIESAVI
jgi:hypothetical protein